MVEINLLPWRKQLEEKILRKKQQVVVVMLVVLAGFFLSHFYFSQQIKQQRTMISNLQTQLINDRLNQTENQQNEASRMAQERTKLFSALNKISEATAYNVSLKKIQYLKGQFDLYGRTASFNDLTRWISGLVAKHKEIVEVKSMPDLNEQEFHVLLRI